MKVNLNEVEIKAAISDWLKKQIPDLMCDVPAPISLMEITAYPATISVTIEFVLNATDDVPPLEKT